MPHKDSFTAVVVSFNRKSLLCRCIRALSEQTRRPDRILVVDNASTDGTYLALRTEGWLSRPEVEWLGLAENIGGAGGFSVGLRHAVDTGADWVWMMDDDALPDPDALEKLVARSPDPANLYASIAVHEDRLAWPIELANDRSRTRVLYSRGLPAEMDVHFAPFLGLLVSAQTIRMIGTPDPGFFIAADDVDYCLRAREQGARIVLVSESRIEHPPSQSRSVSLFGQRITTLRLPPWKRYYDTRNRLLVARKHYGVEYYFKTIPGTLIRLVNVLWFEHDRCAQLRAFMAGFVDGLLGRKGSRHERWGIRV